MGCSSIALAFWAASLTSLVSTACWNAAFYGRRLGGLAPKSAAKAGLKVAIGSIFVVGAVMLGLGFVSGTGAVVGMALLAPLLPVISWAFAVFITSQDPDELEQTMVSGMGKGMDEVTSVIQLAALEIPLFNALVAWQLKEKDVERLNQTRISLDRGLRLVEDLPEVMIGAIDIYFFGASWFATLTMLMSVLMVAMSILVGVFYQTMAWAAGVAKLGRPKLHKPNRQKRPIQDTE